MHIRHKKIAGKIRSLSPRQRLLGIGSVMAITLIGSILLVSSRAAGPYTALEPENGAMSAGASIVNDAAASGGKAGKLGPGAGITGTTYYVDCSAGNDANNGTSTGSAWRTLGKASSAPVNPGDGILLKKDCSFSAMLEITRSGSASSNIIIGAYGTGSAAPIITRNTDGDHISVRASYLTIRDLDLRGVPPRIDNSGRCSGTGVGWIKGVMLQPGSSNNTVTNMQIRGMYSAVSIEGGSHHNKVLYNTLTANNVMNPLDIPNNNNDAGAFGVGIGGDDNEIAYNTIRDNHACSYDYTSDGSAVEIFGGLRNIVHHNTASNNDAFIELGASRADGNVVAYNTFTSGLDRSVFLVSRGGNDVFGPVRNTKMYNNSAYLTSSTSSGVVCYAGCDSSILTMRNNILWAEQGIYVDGAFSESNNIYWYGNGSPRINGPRGSTSRIANPLFVAPGNDLHVQSGSPAVNAGSNESVTNGWNKDLDGTAVPRGSAVDIGAYEF